MRAAAGAARCLVGSERSDRDGKERASPRGVGDGGRREQNQIGWHAGTLRRGHGRSCCGVLSYELLTRPGKLSAPVQEPDKGKIFRWNVGRARFLLNEQLRAFNIAAGIFDEIDG
jgi:hypothetical protein